MNSPGECDGIHAVHSIDRLVTALSQPEGSHVSSKLQLETVKPGHITAFDDVNRFERCTGLLHVPFATEAKLLVQLLPPELEQHQTPWQVHAVPTVHRLTYTW